MMAIVCTVILSTQAVICADPMPAKSARELAQGLNAEKRPDVSAYVTIGQNHPLYRDALQHGRDESPPKDMAKGAALRALLLGR